MQPETRLRAGIALTLVLAVASFVVDSPHGSSVTAAPVSSDGAAVFTARGCIGCHTVNGSGGGIGPDLTLLAARAGSRVDGLDADAYVRQSIREPQAFLVPGFEGARMPTLPLSDTELEAVVQFLLEH